MKMKLISHHKANLESTLCGILQEIKDIDPTERTQLERRIYDNLRPMFRKEDIGDKISDIHIETMIWRDKTFGNHYHASRVSILLEGQKNWDEAKIVKVPYQFGGESMQEQTARDELEKALKTKIGYLHIWCRERGIKLTANYNQVTRQSLVRDFAK